MTAGSCLGLLVAACALFAASGTGRAASVAGQEGLCGAGCPSRAPTPSTPLDCPGALGAVPGTRGKRLHRGGTHKTAPDWPPLRPALLQPGPRVPPTSSPSTGRAGQGVLGLMSPPAALRLALKHRLLPGLAPAASTHALPALLLPRARVPSLPSRSQRLGPAAGACRRLTQRRRLASWNGCCVTKCPTGQFQFILSTSRCCKAGVTNNMSSGPQSSPRCRLVG